jgi:hypothetical protein
MLQILESVSLQLSTDKDPTVRNITVAGETILEFPKDRRTLTVGYGGNAYGTKNGNADEATLNIKVFHGSGDNTWLIAQDAHDFPVFAGTISFELKTNSEGSVTRIYTATDGTIIKHRGITISSKEDNDNQSLDEWTIKFSKVTIS